MRRTIFLALLATLLCASAARAAGTEAILRDCQDDSVLQGHYSVEELRKARRDMDADIREYTDCSDVIGRAIAAKTSSASSGGNGGGSGSSGGGGGGGGGRRRDRLHRGRFRRRRLGRQRARRADHPVHAPGSAGADPGGDPGLAAGEDRREARHAGRRVAACRRCRAQLAAEHARDRAHPARARRRSGRGPQNPRSCRRSPARVNTSLRAGSGTASGGSRCRFPQRRAPALAVVVGAAIAACAFIASGGSRLERTTWVEIGLMLGGAGLTAAAIVQPRPAGTPRAAARHLDAARLRAARRVHDRVAQLVADAGRLVAGGEPDARVPRRRSRAASRSHGSRRGAGARCSEASCSARWRSSAGRC